MLSVVRSGALRSVNRGHGIFRAFASAASGKEPAVVSSVPLKVYSREERIEQWDYVNSVYFGPERDLKNFPNLVQPETAPPVRLGIVPASWFDLFYPKTGVSGPYLFGGGLVLWMLSKEILVIDHYFWEIPTFWTAVWIINYKFGSQIKKFILDSYKRKEEILFTRPISAMRAQEQDAIDASDRLIEETETSKHLYQAKQEGVELQLEAAYRQRLQTAYQEVKKRLDYEVERENSKRRFEQEHMVNWIVSNVTKSITQQQEKESIQSCLRTLKNLAAKHATA